MSAILARMLTEAGDLPLDPVAGLRPKLLGTDEQRLAIPLLAALPGAHDHRQIHASISHWLSKHASDGHHRGIMTLRDANEVILALFFFALRTETTLTRWLEVSRLRAAATAGSQVALGAALRTITGVASRLDCHEALVRAEETSLAWLETAMALAEIAPLQGYTPRGGDWVRALER